MNEAGGKKNIYRETRIRILVDLPGNMQGRRECRELFQELGIKPTSLKFCIQQNDLLKVKEKKDFHRQMRIERVCQQQTCTARNFN